jgi:hypothetical protein
MHPTDEDIARLIDNKVTPAEREEILGHIDDCEECSAVFRNVLKFREIEEEQEERRFLVKIFQGKNVWLPIAAGILLFAILTVFLLYKSHTKISGFSWANAPKSEALRHIEENASKFEEDSSYGFSPNLSIKTISVRLGFYIEDLNRLAPAKEIRVKEKILRLLENVMNHWFKYQIRIPDLDREKIDREFVVAVDRQLESRLKEDALNELYFFGQYIERWIFLCLEGRLPDKGPIKWLIRVSKSNNLARIIPGILEKIQDEKNLKRILKHLHTVREIFL